MRARSCFMLSLILVHVVACSSATRETPAQSPPAPSATPAPEPEEVPEPDPAPEDSEEDWDPNRPIDPRGLRLQLMYVVVDRSAVCPTKEQAEARDCDHSAESASEGLRLNRGEKVTVIAEPPRAGFRRALRSEKAGTLPGWVAAADVAEEPSLSPLDAWDELPQVRKATDVSRMPTRDVDRLPIGTLVKWRRVKAPRFGKFDGDVVLYWEAELGGGVAFSLPPPSQTNEYVARHSCLLSGECMNLDYTCDDAYCDRFSVLARATGRTVPPPPLGGWAYGQTPVPTFKVIHVADRHGIFPTPE